MLSTSRHAVISTGRDQPMLPFDLCPSHHPVPSSGITDQDACGVGLPTARRRPFASPYPKILPFLVAHDISPSVPTGCCRHGSHDTSSLSAHHVCSLQAVWIPLSFAKEQGAFLVHPVIRLFPKDEKCSNCPRASIQLRNSGLSTISHVAR